VAAPIADATESVGSINASGQQKRCGSFALTEINPAQGGFFVRGSDLPRISGLAITAKK